MTDKLERSLTMIARQFPYPTYPLESPRPLLRLRTMRVTLMAIIIIAIPIFVVRIGAVTIHVGPTSELPERFLELAGETTWQQAEQEVGFPLKKPATFPEPDAVYLQNPETVIFVWLAIGDGQTIALYQMKGDQYTVDKQALQVTTTEVNGTLAIWVDMPHSVRFLRDGEAIEEEAHLVDGNVLIWMAGTITYRLETGSDMETARVLAESLIEMGTDSE